jgi:PAS domain S-box-containing protein
MTGILAQYNIRATLMAIGAGVLCLLLSGYGINVHIDDVRITIVWAVVLPILIAMIYGSKYGMIAGLSGGALYPFLIWANNGYANIINLIMLLALFYGVGRMELGKLKHRYLETFIRILIFITGYVIVLFIVYFLLFDKFLSFNPPFWRSDTINSIDRDLLITFLFKDSFNYLFALLTAELFLHLNFIRNFFGLEKVSNLKHNPRVFFFSILTGFIILGIFMAMEYILLSGGPSDGLNYLLLVVTLIVWISVIVIRVLFNFMEKRLESDKIIREMAYDYKESQERLSAILEYANVGVGITDINGSYIMTNTWWQNQLGYSKNELEQLTNIDITYPDDIGVTKERVSELKEGKIDHYRIEKRFVKKDGSVFWGDLSVSAIRDHDSRIMNIIGVINDITDRKKFEEALIKEKSFSKRVIEALPGIFYLYTYPELKLVLWNTNHEKLLGYGPGEIAGRHIMDWHVPEAKPLVKEVVDVVMEKGFNTLESPLLSKNGEFIPFLMTGIRFEADDQMYLLGFGIDITERKNAELALKATDAKQSAMIANISDVIVIIDQHGTNMYKSPNVEKWFGWKPEELIGKIAWDKVHDEDVPDVVEFFEKILSNRKLTDTVECRYRCKDGNYKWIEATATNCLDDPNIKGVLVNYKDISKHKQALALEQEVSVARKSAEFKQKFLANMSHEIRTPLTGVLGMAEILAKTQLNSQQKDYLHTLVESGENLREIINLILDYSKIEAGQVKPKMTNFRLRDIVAETEKLFYSLSQNEIEWEAHVSESLPAIIKSDKQRVNQIIRNLLSNAVKFTNEGKINLSVLDEDNDREKDHLLIRVEVTDTGKGIPEEMQSRLFEPFYQVEDDDARTYEGTGLGLPICKELANLLGGEIGVKSESGKGSSFWFTFRARIVTSDLDEKSMQVEENKQKPGKKLRVMVVEDKVVNQKVISLLLRSKGHTVILARNGLDALSCYQPGEFDLILMDIQMPVMDGLAAATRLKKMYHDVPPIVGLSANAFEGDREKYMQQGLDEYLTKPVNIIEFEELMLKLGLI